MLKIGEWIWEVKEWLLEIEAGGVGLTLKADCSGGMGA